VTWPAVSWDQVPTLSSEALRQADLEARSRFGIEPMQLMEIAGWQVARFLDAYLQGIRGRHVTVVAGSGNNGGDALAAARFLQLRGAIVSASIVPARDAGSLVAHHASTIQRMGIPIRAAPDGIGRSTDAVLDGLLGTGIRPPLRPPAPPIIDAMNATGRPIVAIDVPSGLDADTGVGADAAVRAAATLTLAAPKPGLAGTPNAGRVFVADLGMPRTLFGTDGEALAALYAFADVVELVDPS
jgi:ADP-dependent NAD(P)H-hydrate dehydratase / NAD(P)H-hydrate epimerase